jgi:hypothetical protein
MIINICDFNGNFIISYDIMDNNLRIFNDEYIMKIPPKKISSNKYHNDIKITLKQYPWSIWEKKINSVEVKRLFGANKWKYID